MIGHSPSQPVRLTAPSKRGPRIPAGNFKCLTDFPHPQWGQKCIEFRCHCEPERAWQSPGTIHRSAQQNLRSYREIATGTSALAMTWKFDTSPISVAGLHGVSKGGNGGKVGFQNTFSVPHFGRLGVRDHTGGPGGSLHTFSPERKYEHLSLITDSSTSHLRCSAQNDIGGCSIVPGDCTPRVLPRAGPSQ